MDIAAEICADLGDDWLPEIYRSKVRTQRTRAVRIEVAERENTADIQYTLLGIELKVGRRRFACPDLATARYLRVFARIGVREVAVPYDITKISGIADELETAWQRTLILVDERSHGRSARGVSAVRSKAVKAIREEISEAGAGDPMPAFDRETRQRSTR